MAMPQAVDAPVLTGLAIAVIGFVGVGVTAITTTLAAWLTNRSNERRNRFELRQRLYSEYIAATQRLWLAALARRAMVAAAAPLPWARLRVVLIAVQMAVHDDGLDDAWADVAAKGTALRIVGSDLVVEATNLVSHFGADMVIAAAQVPPMSDDEWEVATQPWHAAVRSFGEAARRSLVPKKDAKRYITPPWTLSKDTSERKAVEPPSAMA